MMAPPGFTAKQVWARDLALSDVIHNVGKVEAVSHVGAFVIVSIRGAHWSLATGGLNRANLDHVFHQADTVLLRDDPR